MTKSCLLKVHYCIINMTLNKIDDDDDEYTNYKIDSIIVY